MKEMKGCIKIMAASLLCLASAVGSNAREKSVCRLTAPLNDEVWSRSCWISAKEAPVVTEKVTNQTRSADGASWFVAPVKNRKRVKSAVWMTTGLGVYDLYVNGRLIGEEILKPGYTHTGKTRRSFTYDITDALNRKAGAVNTLSARLTPGWWADRVVSTRGKKGMNGKKCAFRGALEISYTDGSREIFGTDTIAWRAGIAGKIRHAAIYDGEEFDDREPEGHEVYTKLKTPEINTEFSGEILPTDGAEIYLRRDLEMQPVSAYVWKNIEGADSIHYGKIVISRRYRPGEEIRLKAGEKLVVDFGQNCSAVPRFLFKSAKGTRLRCEPAEILNDGNGAKSRGMDGPEGSGHRTNLRIQDTGVRIDYTFAGAASPVEYIPRATFFGYRYVNVTADNDVSISKITSIPVSSISKDLETGRITTGDSLINRLIANTRWGMLSNYLSIPTDCPQRNERAGWTADTQVFAETGTFFADTEKFLRKWLHDLRDSQTPTGSYPAVAPPSITGSSRMRIGWGDAGIIVPYIVWKQFGDRAVIDEAWDSMLRFIAHADSTGYLHSQIAKECGGYQFADWLSYEPLESKSGRAFANNKPLPETIDYWDFLGASYLAMDARMLAEMAEASGREPRPFREIEKKTADRIRADFLNGKGEFRTEILNTMQTPALFTLYNGILDGEPKEAMISRLRDNFRRHGNCLQTGFLGTSILMGTLTDNGMADIAYDLLFQHKNPSWLYSVDNGATTIWERWNSYTKESGMGPKGMNSFNHYAYGVVCEWIWKTAAGIAADPKAPGFRHIIMKPVPDRRLGSLDAVYRSASGKIGSSWRYDGDRWIWDFTVPEGATATVTLPGQTGEKEYPAGKHHVEVSLPEK